MLKQILILEEVSGREIERQESRVTREDYKTSREEFEVEGFMAQRGSWHIAKKRMLEDRGALPRDDGDLLREYQAMHEESFRSSWLRENVEGEQAKMEKSEEEAKQEESKCEEGSGGRKGEDLRSKEGVWIGGLAKFLWTSASLLKWRVWGFPFGFRCVCACRVHLSVPDVAVPFSSVKRSVFFFFQRKSRRHEW